MEILDIARQLGAAIQADAAYTAFHQAKDACDQDAELQESIGQFNLYRMQVDEELAKDERNNDKIAELNERLRDTYSDIMQQPNMVKYNESKAALDVIVNQVNSIIELSLEGQDPATIDPASACTGSCSTCGGCH